VHARVRAVIALSALGLTVSGLAATSAFAGENQQITTAGGSVVFTHRGERLLAEHERRR
jgi:hypothetical protein